MSGLIHALLPDCGCNVTSHLTLPSPGLCSHDGLHLQTVSPNNPAFLQTLSPSFSSQQFFLKKQLTQEGNGDQDSPQVNSGSGLAHTWSQLCRRDTVVVGAYFKGSMQYLWLNQA